MLEVRSQPTITAANDERVNRELPRFLMSDEVEAISQQPSERKFEGAGSVTCHAGGDQIAVGFRDDVEVLGSDPTRRADELISLKPVSRPNEGQERHVGRRIPTAQLNQASGRAANTRTGLDRRHLERGTRWRLTRHGDSTEHPYDPDRP